MLPHSQNYLFENLSLKVGSVSAELTESREVNVTSTTFSRGSSLLPSRVRYCPLLLLLSHRDITIATHRSSSHLADDGREEVPSIRTRRSVAQRGVR